MDNTDDILVEFIIEAREILDQLDLDFVLLEKTPDDKKLVGNIFRAIHTLKGSSGFFAFKRLEKVTHAGETLLGKIRDGSLALDKQKTSLLLVTLDSVREIVAAIEATHAEPEGDNAQLIEDLLNLANGVALAEREPSETSAATPQPPTAPVQEAATQVLEATSPALPPQWLKRIRARRLQRCPPYKPLCSRPRSLQRQPPPKAPRLRPQQQLKNWGWSPHKKLPSPSKSIWIC